MRFIFLSKYVGIVDRGAETFAIELSHALNARGIYSKCVSLEGGNEICESVKFNWYQKTFIKIVGSVGDLIARISFGRFPLISTDVIETYFFHKIAAIRVHGDDVVVINSFPVGLSSLQCKIKVYVCHSGIGALDRWAFMWHKTVDKYIGLTPSYITWSSKYIPRNKIKLIPNGVNVDKFRLKPKLIKNLSVYETIKILCVAALTSFKRQNLIIESLLYNKKMELTIVGIGECEQDLKDFAKIIGVEDRLKIISVPYSSIGDLYCQYDVFCLLSHNEPFGIVYLEALSAGLPVVAVDDESRRFILERYGFFCPSLVPEEIANTISIAISDKGDPSSRREYVRKRFDWDAIAESYLELV